MSTTQELYDTYATFSTSYSQKKALRRAAADRGVSVSELVRQALRRELDQSPLSPSASSEEDVVSDSSDDISVERSSSPSSLEVGPLDDQRGSEVK